MFFYFIFYVYSNYISREFQTTAIHLSEKHYLENLSILLSYTFLPDMFQFSPWPLIAFPFLPY